MKPDCLEALRDLIQEDVGLRGLASDPQVNLINSCPGDFAAACRSLAQTPKAQVAVVTGFMIPHAQPPSGETDGPLGALYLARALTPLGIQVVLASDAFCLRALEAGINACGLRKGVPLVRLPSPEESGTLSVGDYWNQFADRTGPLTHLIALERVGPSHTQESLAAQPGASETTVAAYLELAPAEHHDRYHTMRGRDITSTMSPAHRLFEAAALSGKQITTIGIGDGGNEIGMGKIAWEVIRRNIPNGGLIACRTPTDYLIVCGVSNWGAYGLAAGVRLVRDAAPDAELGDLEREFELLQLMVERGPLVDGMSGEMMPLVDGLPFPLYADMLRRINDLVRHSSE
jgi:hypothetical protein